MLRVQLLNATSTNAAAIGAGEWYSAQVLQIIGSTRGGQQIMDSPNPSPQASSPPLGFGDALSQAGHSEQGEEEDDFTNIIHLVEGPRNNSAPTSRSPTVDLQRDLPNLPPLLSAAE